MSPSFFLSLLACLGALLLCLNPVALKSSLTQKNPNFLVSLLLFPLSSLVLINICPSFRQERKKREEKKLFIPWDPEKLELEP